MANFNINLKIAHKPLQHAPGHLKMSRYLKSRPHLYGFRGLTLGTPPRSSTTSYNTNPNWPVGTTKRWPLI